MGKNFEGPIRIGLIGCGRMGFHHAEQLLKQQQVGITVLYDAVPDNAERLKNEFHLSAKVVQDIKECADQSLIDACIISSPTGLHYEQTRLFLEAGIAVLCEKPLAHRREEILELIELTERTQTPLTIAYQRRSSSEYRTLRREVLSGKWGKVGSISGAY
ncbi:MAG: Gfo/Idh/MocA family oxidoreductase [Planctomycetaceae bacterium]